MSTKRLPTAEEIRTEVGRELGYYVPGDDPLKPARSRPNEYGPIPDESSRFYDNCAVHAVPERMMSGGLSDSPKSRPDPTDGNGKPFGALRSR